MLGDDDLNAHFSGALHHGVEIIDLEPQQHAVSIWLVIRATDRAVMVLHFEAVQLKDQVAVRNQLLICAATVIAPATQQTLIP